MTSNDALSEHLVKIAKDAALSVKDLLLEGFNAEKSFEEKSGYHDIVTEYDKRSEEMIVDKILSAHPDSTILGEEGGEQGNGEVKWFIDPIDGTMNFATHFPFFCVSIGASVGEEMIAGVIFDPVRNELFYASASGAFCNEKPINTRNNRLESECNIITSYPFIKEDLTENDPAVYREIVNRFRSTRRIGSAALELAYIAAGRTDVVMATQTNAWDIAAGMCLVEKAGGRYIPITTGRTDGSWPPAQYIATNGSFDVESSILGQFL